MILITGVTTTAEENGRRAGYARYVLDKMGRTDVSVAAGADLADGHFRYPELACAIALGWRDGVRIETLPLKLEVRESYLYETLDPTGIPTRLVTQIDSDAFNRHWMNLLCE